MPHDRAVLPQDERSIIAVGNNTAEHNTVDYTLSGEDNAELRWQ